MKYCATCGTELASDSRFCSKCGDPVPTKSIKSDLSLQDLVSNKNLSSGTTALSQSDDSPRTNISRYLFLLFWIFFFPFMVLSKLVNSEVLLRHFARKKAGRKRRG
jgi:uncharacterized membrane protein YvbJ